MAYERNGLHNPNVIDTVQKKVLMNRKQFNERGIPGDLTFRLRHFLSALLFVCAGQQTGDEI